MASKIFDLDTLSPAQFDFLMAKYDAMRDAVAGNGPVAPEVQKRLCELLNADVRRIAQENYDAAFEAIAEAA